MANENPNTSAASANGLRVVDKQGNPLDFGKVLIELASLTTGANVNVTQVADIDTLLKPNPAIPAIWRWCWNMPTTPAWVAGCSSIIPMTPAKMILAW
ncbi:hypothetical protein [Duffyella gerundensis]|uniref:hypothetical protein n=1 Tax=Duffyella gerundensis TaxID=1619313 RepID=UPI00165446F8|nr:hypothetical protein [Duffyella gerundensis]